VKLVIVESPYAGDIDRNVAYARAAVRDSVLRGEAPMASHILFTQEGFLRDEIEEERDLGIAAGIAWRRVCDNAAFYVDLGWSRGMLAARALYQKEGIPFCERRLFADAESVP
jgi:hypothetical protein